MPIMQEILDLTKATDSIANVEDASKWGIDLKKITGI
jgi:hypothetical protein